MTTLTQLCSGWKTFLGAFAMICILLSIALFVANYFINSGKPRTTKNPLLWNAAIAAFGIAVLGIAVYVIAPPLLNAFGIETEPPECRGTYPNPPAPPYCGDYCHNSSIPKASENCTCLMYRYE